MSSQNFLAGYQIRNLSDFRKAISKKAVILFSQANCPPCANFYPHFERVTKQFKDLPIYWVNAREAMEINNITGIRSVPQVRLYVEGKHHLTLGDYTFEGLAAFIKYLD